MASYAIPAVYRSGFLRLAELEDAAYGKLAEAIAIVTPSAIFDEWVNSIARHADVPNDVVQDIVASLLSLAVLRTREGISADGLVDKLSLAPLKLLGPRKQTLSTRLVALLEIPALRVATRAVELLAADRVLISSRIITDIRPVFPDPDETPEVGNLESSGALVVHTLRLEYLEAGESGTFVVSMDRSDIEKLGSVLTRALRKAEAAEAILDAASVPVLTASRGDG